MSRPAGSDARERYALTIGAQRSSSARALSEQLRRKPNLVVTLLLLTLIGLRPARLSRQLRASDETAWLDFRSSLIQRWQTVMITTGLVMGAAASAVFSDKVARGSYLLALGSLCSSVLTIGFGTGLEIIYQRKKLARRPVYMLALLASPTFFAIGAMLCFYASITALSYQILDSSRVNVLARMGTTGGAALMVGIFAGSAWLVWDIEKADVNDAEREISGFESGEATT
ncbi:hypothetical protein B0H16DRAFT_1568844 [Mycena metata]|uniref:Uncharacterized protein n=1 Tax=Mycena metata TaxID=1033252 RepID=A0AAD7N0V9_9AGAR|nr:hypothetical protein B0H16DRAFT_1568844 [Mycena metata]